MPDVSTTSPDPEAVGSSSPVVAVIPAHNESRFIGSVVIEALTTVDIVLVIDDGSQDNTAYIAKKAGATVVPTGTNLGKAKALELGFKAARDYTPSVVVTLDGDGQHSPLEIPAVIQPILDSGSDMVIGSRFSDIEIQAPWWRQIGQRGLTWLTNVTAGTPSTDSQSGFRAFAPNSLETFSIRTSGFSIESEMQFWANDQNLSVSEIPISCLYEEKSKRNPIKHGLQVLNGIFSLVIERRPLFYLGLLGAFLTTLGASGWWWTISIYRQLNQLAVGYALISTLLIIVGLVFIFQGITLNELRKIMERQGPIANGDTWILPQVKQPADHVSQTVNSYRSEYLNGS